MTNEAHAGVHDISGQLQEDAITNDGSFTVGRGASMTVVPLQGVYGEPASFANDGALVNDGSITANQTAGAVTWTQAGGPIKGNEVVLGGGATLVDRSGAAQFFVSSIAAKLTGTIPVGQKITVVGEAYNSNGDAYNGTTLALDGSEVVNDGTIVLEAQGSGFEDRWPGDRQRRRDPQQRHHRGRGQGSVVDDSVSGRARQHPCGHAERDGGHVQ